MAKEEYSGNANSAEAERKADWLTRLAGMAKK